MTTLREHLENAVLLRLFPQHMQRVTRMFDIMEDAYQRGGLIAPPEKVLQMLQEDGQLIDLILRTRGAAFAIGYGVTERDRVSAIRYARRMADTNINIESAIKMWTDFGMGKRVEVRSDDTAADEAITEFMGASRNAPILGQRNLHELSEDVLNEGELAFAFWYSPVDGLATVRTIPTDQISIVWEDATDKTIPLAYVRQTDKAPVWYPDWRATDDQLRNAAIPDGARRADSLGDTAIQIGGRTEQATKVVVLWANRNRNKELGRGIPAFLNALEWATVLQDFMGDRAAVARKAAMYTETVTVQGGSRVLGQFKDRLQSSLVSSGHGRDRNPPPVAASDWLQNEQVQREWQNRDTGATAARFDGRMIAGQLSVATGIGLHWLGFPDAITGGLATAEEMKVPFWLQIERYQLWLGSFFEDAARCALMLRRLHGQPSLNEQAKIMATLETHTAIVLEQVVALLAEVRQAVEKGVLPFGVGMALSRELIILAMSRLGIKEPDQVFDRAVTAGPEGVVEMAAKVVGNFKAGKVDADAAVSYLMTELLEVASRNGHSHTR